MVFSNFRKWGLHAVFLSQHTVFPPCSQISENEDYMPSVVLIFGNSLLFTHRFSKYMYLMAKYTKYKMTTTKFSIWRHIICEICPFPYFFGKIPGWKFQANPVPKNPGILQNPIPEIPGLKILHPAGACLWVDITLILYSFSLSRFHQRASAAEVKAGWKTTRPTCFDPRCLILALSQLTCFTPCRMLTIFQAAFVLFQFTATGHWTWSWWPGTHLNVTVL